MEEKIAKNVTLLDFSNTFIVILDHSNSQRWNLLRSVFLNAVFGIDKYLELQKFK